MDQITQQLSFRLIGGWYQADFGFKKIFQKVKSWGKKPFQFDFIDWLISKATFHLSNLKTTWITKANEIWSDADKILEECKAVPVTRRSKSDKAWIIRIHVSRAAANKAKRAYKYACRKLAWTIQ